MLIYRVLIHILLIHFSSLKTDFAFLWKKKNINHFLLFVIEINNERKLKSSVSVQANNIQ